MSAQDHHIFLLSPLLNIDTASTNKPSLSLNLPLSLPERHSFDSQSSTKREGKHTCHENSNDHI